MFLVQFITHQTERYSYLDSARMALEGGCRWIQLRMKDAPEEEAERVARQVQALCKEWEAMFIIDDRVELVKRLQADGVHLGKLDMPIGEARAYLGPEYIIGGTANTMEDIRRIAREDADYIVCGPFRYTETKKNLAPILGEEGYRDIVCQKDSMAIKLPVVGIGGIRADDIPLLMSIGLDGIALSGSILQAPDPVEAMRHILQLAESSY